MKTKNLILAALAGLSISLTSCDLRNNRVPGLDNNDINQNIPQVDNEDALKDAYEKAIQSGNFKGTYEEWLSLIKGENGELGVQKDEALELYNRYKENNPNYTKSFEERVNDILNNNLDTRSSYTVTFNSNGGNEVENQIVLEGKKIIEPTDPIKEGYTFAGWMFNNKIIDFNSFLVTEDTVLLASWTINEYKVNINYGTETPSETRTLNYNSSLTLEDVSKDGFRFLGWFDEDKNEKITFPIIIKENLNLVARFSDTIKINFDTNGGNPLDPIEVKIGSTLESLPTPTHSSAKFVNWSIVLSGVNKEAVFPMVINSTNDLTFIANWKETSTDFEYSINNNEVTITGYVGKDVDIVIPALIKNMPVTKLVSSAFKDNKEITSIKMTSIKTIDDFALSNCTNLNYVDFGTNVLNYGNSVLLNDNKISKISAPMDCALLKLFDFSVTSLPSNLSIHLLYKPGVNNLTMFNNCKMFKFNEISMSDEITICPDLSHMHITSLKFSNNITELISDCFRGSEELESVTLPSNLLTIGDWFFNNCVNLKEVNFPDTVKTICPYSFSNCTSLTKLVLPDKLESLGYNAFEGCTGITDITIPKTLTEILNNTFKGCTNLRTLNLPSTLKTFFASSIINTSIHSVVLPSGLTYFNSDIDKSALNICSYYVPKTVETLILSDAPEGITIYYEGNETMFKELTWEQEEKFVKKYNVICNSEIKTLEPLKNDVFEYTVNENKEYRIINWVNPNVEIIDYQSMFPDATSIQFAAEFPHQGCKATQIYLHECMTDLRLATLYNCSKLKFVDLKNVKTIGIANFDWDNELKTIVLPSTFEKSDDDFMSQGNRSDITFIFDNNISALPENVINGHFSSIFLGTEEELAKLVTNKGNIKCLPDYSLSHKNGLTYVYKETSPKTIDIAYIDGAIPFENIKNDFPSDYVINLPSNLN